MAPPAVLEAPARITRAPRTPRARTATPLVDVHTSLRQSLTSYNPTETDRGSQAAPSLTQLAEIRQRLEALPATDSKREPAVERFNEGLTAGSARVLLGSLRKGPGPRFEVMPFDAGDIAGSAIVIDRHKSSMPRPFPSPAQAHALAADANAKLASNGSSGLKEKFDGSDLWSHIEQLSRESLHESLYDPAFTEKPIARHERFAVQQQMREALAEARENLGRVSHHVEFSHSPDGREWKAHAFDAGGWIREGSIHTNDVPSAKKLESLARDTLGQLDDDGDYRVQKNRDGLHYVRDPMGGSFPFVHPDQALNAAARAASTQSYSDAVRVLETLSRADDGPAARFAAQVRSYERLDVLTTEMAELRTSAGPGDQERIKALRAETTALQSTPVESKPTRSNLMNQFNALTPDQRAYAARLNPRIEPLMQKIDRAVKQGKERALDF